MKITVDRSTFLETFKKVRPDNFSNKGLNVLYDFLTELEEDIGEEMELDVIAICCDYVEATYEEVRRDFNLEAEEDILEYLNTNTIVIKVDDDTIIYQNF
jgi:hypothetical protein